MGSGQTEHEGDLEHRNWTNWTFH